MPRRPRVHTGRPIGAMDAQSHPRFHARQLHGELAAKDDDRSDVLQRRGEPQLTDQRRPPLRGLDRHVAHQMQPQPNDAGGQCELEQSERLELERPQGHAAEDRARLTARGDRTGDRSGDEYDRQQRALPGTELDTRRDESGAIAESDRRQAEQGAARRPRRHRPGQPVRSEDASDGTHDRTHEQEEPDLADGRTAHGRRPVDGGEQHMTDVGSVERQRSTATT